MRVENRGSYLAINMNQTLNNEAFQTMFEKPQIKIASFIEANYDNLSENLISTLLKCASKLESLELHKSAKLILQATDNLIDELTHGLKDESKPEDVFKPKDNIKSPITYPEHKPDMIMPDKGSDLLKPEVPEPLKQ